jgi:hypothetical protein
MPNLRPVHQMTQAHFLEGLYLVPAHLPESSKGRTDVVENASVRIRLGVGREKAGQHASKSIWGLKVVQRGCQIRRGWIA